ncbi:uncharacterized protein LOC133814203 [Humulus lupulus]|uniref:uncharacterized protein LOC133814203 n=1 Tax=Humulus lupulus TaxID=3486 RepID=UPI002B402BC4|nr:uncharacterized protein LOC133814203 [Humulus lupulus]
MDRALFVALRYSVQTGHSILYDQQTKVQWSKYVWERCTIPKHRYILWLAMQQRLRTRVYLSRFWHEMDKLCLLCGDHNEDISHLFFQCTYSNQCLKKMKDWLGCRAQTEDFYKLLQWFSKVKYFSKLRKKFCIATVTALVYHLWRVQNDALWSCKIWQVNHTLEGIKTEMKMRLTVLLYKGKKDRDNDWIQKLYS